MARVTLSIGGRSHVLACRDGEEEHVERLGAMLEQRAAAAQRGAGTGGAERMMLLIALMLADDLAGAEHRPEPAEPDPTSLPDLDAIRDAAAAAARADAGAEVQAMLAAVADRLEAVAAALEDEAATS